MYTDERECQFLIYFDVASVTQRERNRETQTDRQTDRQTETLNRWQNEKKWAEGGRSGGGYEGCTDKEKDSGLRDREREESKLE